MPIRSLRELFARIPSSEGRVRHLLRNFNFGMVKDGRMPSVRDLAIQLGFDVLLCEMPRSERGRLVKDGFSENGYRIEVNSADDVRTRRWTVLHEIVHWLLHRDDDVFAFDKFRAGKMHFYDADQLREEREANEFAEALIFGDGALDAAIGLWGDDLEQLAKYFGVSKQTLGIALNKHAK